MTIAAARCRFLRQEQPGANPAAPDSALGVSDDPGCPDGLAATP